MRSCKWQQSPSSLKRLLKIKPSMTRGLASFLVLRHRWIDQPLALDVLDGELMYSGMACSSCKGGIAATDSSIEGDGDRSIKVATAIRATIATE
jgi:hypothetical protein